MGAAGGEKRGREPRQPCPACQTVRSVAAPEVYSGVSQTRSLAWLLELYEYQVSDLVAGREPRGGERSVRELRGRLWQADWPAPLRRRLIRTDHQYRTWQATRRQLPQAQSLEAQPAQPPAGKQSGSVPTLTRNAQEDAAWAELRQLAWHADLMAEMHEATQQLRHEPGRPTLRVLYAVTENAERAARQLPTLFPVPGAHDTLVSLGNSEVVRQLTRTLGDMLLLPGGAAQVWQALDRIEDNPFPPQPGDDVLQAQLSAVRRGSGSPHERWRLEEALRASAGPQSELWADPRERPALREAAQAIRHWLARRLELAPRHGSGAEAAHPALLAPEPGSALSSAAAGDSLILHLGGPDRVAHWQGLRLTWRSLGPNWQVLVQDETSPPVRGGQLALLRPELPASERQLRLDVGGQQLQLLFSGDYALLRRRADAAQTRRLARLAAVGRACAVLLLPGTDSGRLRLARALAQRLLGDPRRTGDLPAAEVRDAEGPDAGLPGTAAPHPDHPFSDALTTARRTLRHLHLLLPRFTSAEVAHTARAAQAELGLPPHYAAQVRQAAEHAAGASEVLHDPPSTASAGRDPAPTFLSASGQFLVFGLDSEPLELRLPGERLLTLRPDHRAELVAVRPGQPAIPVGDLLVLPLHDLSVVVAREGSQVAVCALATGPLEAGAVGTAAAP